MTTPRFRTEATVVGPNGRRYYLHIMHWQVVDDIPGPEPQDVRLASFETESTALIHF